MYVLGVPNTEVRLGLIQNLMPLYSSMDPDDTVGVARRMSNALNRGVNFSSETRTIDAWERGE
jgi:hypothetical protein